MLKIKDDYDLDGLEKYGFKHEKDETIVCNWDYWEYHTNYTQYAVYPKNREIDLYGSDEYANGLDTLYNMIVDGIVEKGVE